VGVSKVTFIAVRSFELHTLRTNFLLSVHRMLTYLNEFSSGLKTRTARSDVVEIILELLVFPVSAAVPNHETCRNESRIANDRKRMHNKGYKWQYVNNISSFIGDFN
jgi:hypothetical protein